MFQRGSFLIFFEPVGQEAAEPILAQACDAIGLPNHLLPIVEWVEPNLAVVGVLAGAEEIIISRLLAANIPGIRMIKLNYERPQGVDRA